MATPPQPAPYRAETAILALGDDYYDAVEPAEFPRHLLRFRNDRWAAAIGLETLDDKSWIDHFGRFEPLPDNLRRPLALRYHGHQFRTYNPDIGDGRGFLFAQLRDGAGRLLDLGTKGSGQTPYSRFGDGRLTLKGGVREVLATEMLEALGVETSKSLSLIETGEALERNDEPSPTRSAVLVRLSHSHIRIGTFQRLAYLDQPDNIRRLADYCLTHLFGDQEEANTASPRLLSHVVRGTALLAASYIAAGFVHGVLNSDNINITAESFDYGPWRWTPFWDGHFTATYFDQFGLYAFARQAEAIHWNLVQLARALRLVSEAEPLTSALERFPEAFQRALRDKLFARLGIVPRGDPADTEVLVAIEQALSKQTVTIDRFFFDWRGGHRRSPSPAEDAYGDETFERLAVLLREHDSAKGALDHDYWSDAEPCTMHIDEVESIWARIDEADDWEPFHAKVDAVRRMGRAMGNGGADA